MELTATEYDNKDNRRSDAAYSVLYTTHFIFDTLYDSQPVKG